MSACVFRDNDKAKAFQIAYELIKQLADPDAVEVQCDHSAEDPKIEWEVWLYTDAVIVQLEGGIVQEVIGADHNHQVIVLDWDDHNDSEPVSTQVWEQ